MYPLFDHCNHFVQWNPVNTVTNGPKKIGLICNGVTVLNRVFLQENVWPFCQAAKKSDHNNEVTVFVAVRRGFTVLTKMYKVY